MFGCFENPWLHKAWIYNFYKAPPCVGGIRTAMAGGADAAAASRHGRNGAFFPDHAFWRFFMPGSFRPPSPTRVLMISTTINNPPQIRLA